MEHNKLRVSYSLINTWKNGGESRFEKTRDLYLHLATFSNKAIQAGTEYDKKIKEYIMLHRSMPPEMGGRQLLNPQCQKFVVPYNEIIDISLDVDMVDTLLKELHEFKFSYASDSADFAGGWQMSMYFFGFHLMGIDIEKGYLHRVEPAKYAHFLRTGEKVEGLYDVAHVWPSKRRLDQAELMIAEYAPQIYQAFVENGVL